MPENVMIFFDNGMKAKFPVDKVIFMSNDSILCHNDNLTRALNRAKMIEELLFDQDMSIVNWDNVCFIRKDHKKDDEDGGESE